jgi:glycosyltransferase involved in cell wall biosynthesis
MPPYLHVEGIHGQTSGQIAVRMLAATNIYGDQVVIWAGRDGYRGRTDPKALVLSNVSYLCFLGRICPIKGTHNAIEIAKRAGMPLKIAGEVHPMFRDYFEAKIKPHIDGRNIEFVGVANHSLENELLGRATALLFPIEWNEPFGLVMVEFDGVRNASHRVRRWRGRGDRGEWNLGKDLSRCRSGR